MKLSDEQIAAIKTATGLSPIPVDTAAQREFEPHFGVHSFYPDRAGLFIFEPGTGHEDGEPAPDMVHGVQLAEWLHKEDGGQSVGIVEPTPIHLVVNLKTFEVRRGPPN